MKLYNVYFKIFDKKLKRQVIAESYAHARLLIMSNLKMVKHTSEELHPEAIPQRPFSELMKEADTNPKNVERLFYIMAELTHNKKFYTIPELSYGAEHIGKYIKELLISDRNDLDNFADELDEIIGE